MHYTEKREATANIGKCLQSLGWKLFGWKEDRSDSMTDYFDPESWEGIAEKNGFVCVVDISTGHKSGQDILSYESVCIGDVTCTACNGTGEKKDDSTELLHINFSSGKLEPVDVCHICNGNKTTKKYETKQAIIDTYPTFSGNPNHKKWHVQDSSGNILASGIGLNKCLGYSRRDKNYQESIPGAYAIAQKIDRCTQPKKEQPTPVKVDGITLTENKEKQGLELRFPDKPDEDIRNGLKSNGWRWSRFNKCWWKKDSETARTFANNLTGQA